MTDTSRTLTRTLRPSTAQQLRQVLAIVSPVAWSALGVALLALAVGRQRHWVELTVIGAMILVLLAISVCFTLGRTEMAVEVAVRPQRVQAGEHAAAMVTVANASGGRLLPVTMELTVGDGVAQFRVPFLGQGEAHDDVFLLPTRRRAIIPVGPATSVRSDPLGLLRRSQTWTGVQPLFVHPRVVSLHELGTGFLRDLEGTVTNQLSDADVAFHALREYQPGDDRRYIHWRTTARVGKHMIRQFEDTRRSHVGIVVDGTKGAYRDEEDFDTAVSVAASLGLRAMRDEQDLSMVVSGDRIPSSVGSGMLDTLSGVDLAPRGSGLVTEVNRMFTYASGFSLAVLITGANTSVSDLRAASTLFPLDVRVVMVRVDVDAEPALQPLGDQRLLTLAVLEDLPELLWRAAA